MTADVAPVVCQDCGRDFRWVSDYLTHDCIPTHPRSASIAIVAGLVGLGIALWIIRYVLG